MSRRLFTKLLILALSVLLGQQVPSLCAAQPLSPQSNFSGRDQVLVLKNGNVLSGSIEQHADHFTVRTQQGSRLIIAADKASFVADSLEQVYWGQLARTRASDSDAQQSLFYWCLKNQLYDAAKNQLEVLQATGVERQRLDQLHKRLADSIAAHNAVDLDSNVVGSQQPSEPTALASSLDQISLAAGHDFFADGDPIFSPLPSMTLAMVENRSLQHSEQTIYKTIRSPADPVPTEVAQVSYAEPLDSDESNKISESKVAGDNQYRTLSVHELESFLRELPQSCLGNFRQHVERTLIQQCSQCHRLESPAMPLIYRGKLKTQALRMSQRNLHSAMHFVDRAAPAASRLLSAATTAHGGSETPALDIDSVEYEKLLAWVVSLDQHPNRFDRESEAVLAEPARFDDRQIAKDYAKPIEKPASMHPTDKDRRTLNHLDVPPTIGAIPDLETRPAAFIPRDEFDPEIFHRMSSDRD